MVGLFSWNANQPDSYSAMEMRRRIAMQMMSGGKKGYPKTFGEGLSYIGDALGDIAMWRAMQSEAARQKAQDEKIERTIRGGGTTIGDAGGDTTGSTGTTIADSAVPPAPPVTMADVVPSPPESFTEASVDPTGVDQGEPGGPWGISAPVAPVGDATTQFVPSGNLDTMPAGSARTAAANYAYFPNTGKAPEGTTAQPMVGVPSRQQVFPGAGGPQAAAPEGVHPNVASWHQFAIRPVAEGGLSLSPAQAAGVVSNLQRESTPQIKPWGVVGDQGTAFGSAQWREGRFANLKSFSAANGMDYRTPEAQQAFMRHELTGSGAHGGGSEAAAYKALLAAQDPRAAATAFNTGYERSADRAGIRERVAEQLARQFGAVPPPDTSAMQQARSLPPLNAPPPGPQAAASPTEAAQDETLSLLSGKAQAPGMSPGPATAAVQPAEVMSDAPGVGTVPASLDQGRNAVTQAIVDQQQPDPRLAQAWPAPGAPQVTLPPSILQQLPRPPQPQGQVTTIPRAPDFYDRPEPTPPTPPRKPTMGPEEMRLQKYIAGDYSPQVKTSAQQVIDAERQRANARFEYDKAIYEQKDKVYQKDLEQWRDARRRGPYERAQARSENVTATKGEMELGGYGRRLESEEAGREAETRKKISEAEVQAEEARIVSRTGMKPTELYKRLDEDKANVDQTIRAQSAQQMARKAIKDGVITGYGANMRVAGAKFADWALRNGMSGDMAANTEIMSAGLKTGLSEAIKTINGEGGVGVSNNDVRIAEGLSGSDPNLQMKTITSIMDRAAEINHRKINSYEEKIDRYLSGEKAEANYRTAGSTIPQDKLQILLNAQSDPAKGDQMKKYFNETYGPGAAELEIARFKRAQRRQGKD